MGRPPHLSAPRPDAHPPPVGPPRPALHVQRPHRGSPSAPIRPLPVPVSTHNPGECVWSHTKYGDLANFAPDCLRTLEHAVVTSLSQTRSRRDLFEGFFHGAGL